MAVAFLAAMRVRTSYERLKKFQRFRTSIQQIYDDADGWNTSRSLAEAVQFEEVASGSIQLLAPKRPPNVVLLLGDKYDHILLAKSSAAYAHRPLALINVPQLLQKCPTSERSDMIEALLSKARTDHAMALVTNLHEAVHEWSGEIVAVLRHHFKQRMLLLLSLTEECASAFKNRGQLLDGIDYRQLVVRLPDTKRRYKVLCEKLPPRVADVFSNYTEGFTFNDLQNLTDIYQSSRLLAMRKAEGTLQNTALWQ
ncbi:hypothetical protein AAVH_21167 [Aphelenchoides avenae]|nr:hypothetical protein AAVH_21167 [Aphelenchus avenae]